MNREAESSIEILVYLIVGLAAALAIFVFGIPAIMRPVSSGTNALKNLVIPESASIDTATAAVDILLQDNVEATLDSYDKTATAQFQDDYSKLTNVNDKINYFYSYTKLLINTLSDGLKKKGDTQGVTQLYELSQELDANKAYALANVAFQQTNYPQPLSGIQAQFQQIVDHNPSTFAAVQNANTKLNFITNITTCSFANNVCTNSKGYCYVEANYNCAETLCAWIPFCNSCSKINTPQDYTSQDACTKDPCSKAQPGTSRSWDTKKFACVLTPIPTIGPAP